MQLSTDSTKLKPISGDQVRILILTKTFPYPPISGLALRNFNIIKRLGKDHEIWLLAFTEKKDNKEQKFQLQKYCQNIFTFHLEKTSALNKPMDFFRYLLNGTPPDFRFRFIPEMANKARQLCRNIEFDIADIIDTDMAMYHDFIPEKKRPKTILTFIDVQHIQYNRIYRVEKKLTRKFRLWLHSYMLKHWEPQYAKRFDQCVAVSPVDRNILLAHNPNLKIDVIPNGIDTKIFQPLPHKDPSNNLIFVGNMGYRPNIDAMIYFCNDILPLIRRSIPDVETWIVGIDPAEEVLNLEGDHVYVTGRVEDVRPFYQQSDACVIPLRAGGGTRLKILESMALGRPVVSTSIGCEGIEAIHGKHILLADNPASFAESTIRLLTDKALSEKIANNARRLVETRYDWDIIVQSLIKTYTDVVKK